MNAIAASPVRYRLRTHLNTLVVGLVAVTGLAIGGFGYQKARELALEHAEARFQQLGREAAATVEALNGPVESVIGVLAGGQLAAQRNLEGRMRFVPALARTLERNPRMSALYVGYGDGAFFLVRALRGEAGAELGGPRNARYLVQSRTAAPGSGVYIWLDERLRELDRDARPDYAFDPRERPWYKAATQTDTLVRGDPYAFFTTFEVGKTYAQRSVHGEAVVGADFTLTALSGLLAEQTRDLDASAEVAVFNDAGIVIAHRDPRRAVVQDDVARRSVIVAELKSAVLAEALNRSAFGETGRLLAWKDGGEEWRILLTRLPEAGTHAEFLAAAIPLKALLAPADRALTTTLLVIAAILLGALPLAWLVSHSVAQPLERLAGEATAMRRFDFGEPGEAVHSRIIEVDGLARSLAATRGTIRRFREVSRAVTAEQDFGRLIERVLDESLALAGASAGAVRLVSAEGGGLVTAAARGAEFPLDAEVPSAVAVAAQGAEATVISVPLFDRGGHPLGVLSIARAGPGHRVEPGDDLVAFLGALAGTLAVAIENQKLLKEQKDLLEALIQLVAGAIDAKSPYTGGHCQRVPVLTKMLVQAACDVREGPLADYSLSAEEWEAVHIGAWLHDCGKVTTPEYVVDKATKLETIYDRLHEIRTRFEVLKRDADVAYWKGVAEGGDRAALASARDRLHRELDAEFAFVAECNEGGEFMAPERVARLKQIGARTWTRTLDDRLGVSNDEKKRKAAAGAPPPPVIERLLDDKAEHVVKRAAADLMPADNKWGFKVKVPEHKWNLGEIYNLSIGRGTLTEEERFVINDHMVQTIKMLTALPFPRHLRSVPEIAGGHHEKMDGTGYPKRLKRDEMSVAARCMAIADIFEALTAGDRPYKKGKTLSEALRIMGGMKKGQHVDPDLFELFLRSGVYLRYAERFCSPEQIDTADIAPYLGNTS